MSLDKVVYTSCLLSNYVNSRECFWLMVLGDMYHNVVVWGFFVCLHSGKSFSTLGVTALAVTTCCDVLEYLFHDVCGGRLLLCANVMALI